MSECEDITSAAYWRERVAVAKRLVMATEDYLHACQEGGDGGSAERAARAETWLEGDKRALARYQRMLAEAEAREKGVPNGS